MTEQAAPPMRTYQSVNGSNARLKNSSPFSINILFQFTQDDFHTFVAMMLKRQSKGNVVYFSLAGQQWGAYPYL